MGRSSDWDYIVIGAGLSGLSIAHFIQHQLQKKVLVLEKSRGVGGRLATRRGDQCTFDHGAQFYKLRQTTQLLHQLCSSQNSSRLWFHENNNDHFVGTRGMTSIAKCLSHSLNIQLNQRAITLKLSDGLWTLITEDNSYCECKNLILTAPLPQSLELLNNNSIVYNQDLSMIGYHSALVFLIERPITLTNVLKKPYSEINNDKIFSISDQKSKGLSNKEAWTVTMSPQWSAQYFNCNDEEILSYGLSALQSLIPDLTYEKIQLKKWKYSHPIQPYHQKFYNNENNLFLAGDGFAGGSINGAIESAKALQEYLTTNDGAKPFS